MTKVISISVGQQGENPIYFEYLDCLLLFVASTYKIFHGWTFCIQLTKGAESTRYANILEKFGCKVKLKNKENYTWKYALWRYDVINEFPKFFIDTWVAIDIHYDGLYKYYNEKSDKRRLQLAHDFLNQINTFASSDNVFGVIKWPGEPTLRLVAGGLFASQVDLNKQINIFLDIIDKHKIPKNEEELFFSVFIEKYEKRPKVKNGKYEGYGKDELFLNIVYEQEIENENKVTEFTVKQFKKRAIQNELTKKVVKSIKNNQDIINIVKELKLKFNDRPPPTI